MKINSSLQLHRIVVVLIYLIAFYLTREVLALPEAQKDLLTTLSSGALLATFGSAVGSICLIWQNDLIQRINLNIEILYKDILKSKNSWRRWPFLSRSSTSKLLNGSSHTATLSNPVIPLNVGTHTIHIDLPTVFEDFFDLPTIKNFWPLIRFRKFAHTILQPQKKETPNSSGLTSSDNYMAYECLLDTWRSIFKFRVARYVLHFASGITLTGSFITLFYLWKIYL